MTSGAESGARAATAAVAGATAAVIVYAVLRVVSALRGAEADPALVIWSPHAGFFWRSWTAAYVGGMLAFVAYALGPERTARVLSAGVVVAAAAIAAQGILLP